MAKKKKASGVLVIGENPSKVIKRIEKRRKETIMALKRLSEGEFFNQSKKNQP